MKNAGVKFLLFLFTVISVFAIDSSAEAKVLYRKKFNIVKLVDTDKDVNGSTAPDHPQILTEAKLHNMLATIRFDKKSLLFEDQEDIRLFSKKSLELLVPELAKGFAKANSKQLVYFTIVQKASTAKVFRNDRVIRCHSYIYGGEFFLKCSKLYAKIFGDYEHSARQGQTLINKARDLQVSFDLVPGQRRLGQKFIALKIDQDWAATLDQILAAEKNAATKAAAEKDQSVKSIPVPDSPENAKTKAEATPQERLKILDELKREGLISEQEYKKKRQDILSEI